LFAVAAACGYAAYRSAQRRKAFNTLSPAEQQRSLAIREANKAVKTAAKDYSRHVKETRRALEKARAPQKLGRFKTEHVGDWKDAFKGEREFVLWDDKIKTPSGERSLTSHVAAVVDTAGNLAHTSRSTLTRMGAGAVIAGPLGFLVGVAAKKGKTLDNRELYLFVEGEDWADSTNCDPGKEGRKVRDFAQKVNLAVRNVERVKAERERSVKDLTERLAAVEADRSAIEEAERARAALGTDPMAASQLPATSVPSSQTA
jgi:hypothetical protein